MAYSPSPLLKIALIQVGTEDGTWGTIVNNYVFGRLEQAIHGGVIINAVGNTYTLDDENFQGTESHYKVLMIQGVLTQNIDIIVPDRSHEYTIINDTSGSYNVVIKTSAGAGVTFTTGGKGIVYCNGTDVISIYSAGDFLSPANNLSDLDNIATARANLGLTAGETARTTLGLGNASLLDTGTGINQLLKFTTANTLPALDGSALTGVIGVASKSAYSVKTTGYTAVAGDLGSVISFTTAGVTLALTAAATLGNGWWCMIKNNAASGVITINPNGSETLDTFATRKLRPGDSVTIICDGTNFHTIRGTYSYISGAITPSPAANGTLNHELDVVPSPTDVGVIMKCISTSNNYTNGDELVYNIAGPMLSNFGIALVRSATTLTYRVGAAGLTIMDFSGGGTIPAPTNNWEFYIYAKVTY